MKKYTYFISLLFICSLISCSSTKQIMRENETFQYATRDNRKLYLDRITDTTVKVEGKRPIFIYSFGGGWEVGERNEKLIAPFFKYLTSIGYTVVTIDYRLGIKEAKASGEMNDKNGIDMYLRAIQWGVEDLYEATSFVLKHADEWNIDTNQIVIGGSSAGATNSLCAEYELCNYSPLAAKYLPKDFNYAGVVAMAGAIWLKGENTPLVWSKPPCPIMFFHGSKDQLVTYDEAHAGFSGYGPAYIHKQFANLDYANWFMDLPGADHTMSLAPVIDYREEIKSFLTRFVKEKQHSIIHTIVNDKVKKTFENIILLYGDYFSKYER